MKGARRSAEAGRKKCPQLISRPHTRKHSTTPDRIKAHGAVYNGDQCGQDRLRRRHRWIVRRAQSTGCSSVKPDWIAV